VGGEGGEGGEDGQGGKNGGEGGKNGGGEGDRQVPQVKGHTACMFGPCLAWLQYGASWLQLAGSTQ